MEQGGVHAGLGVIEIGDGLLDADPKDALPHAVGDGHGKTRIVRRGHPLGELRAEVLLFLRLQILVGFLGLVIGPGDELGFHRIAGLAIIVFVIIRQLQIVLRAVLHGHGVHADNVFGLLPGKFVIERGQGAAHISGNATLVIVCLSGTKEGRHLVELPLCPIGERMIVALGAGNVRAEEGAECQREVIKSHASIPQQVTGRAVVEQLSICGHHREDCLIPRHVVGDLALQPVLVGVKPGLLSHICDAKHVGEVVEEMAAVAIGVEQLVNDLCPLRDAGVSDEFEGFFACRDTPGDVEIHAAHELLIGGQRVRLLSALGEAAINEQVDAGGRLREIRVRRDTQAFWLQRLHRLLIHRAELVERQAIHIAISHLKEDLAVFDAAEGRFQFAPLCIGPSLGIRADRFLLRRKRGHERKKREDDRGLVFHGLRTALVSLLTCAHWQI